MKRFFSILLCAVILTGLLSGCSGKSSMTVKLNKKDALTASLYSPSESDFSYDSGNKGVKLFTNVEGATDPYVNFNLGNYLEEIHRKKPTYEQYKYVLLKIKAENCSNPSFELFFATCGINAAGQTCRASANFDNGTDDWQYLLFDFTTANTLGEYTYFRFDYEMTALHENESVVISEIIFCDSFDTAYRKAGFRAGSDNVLSKAEKKELDKLLKSAPGNVPEEYQNYRVKKASSEDSGINLWFNHTYTRTPEAQVKKDGTDTYCLRMAKNEIEACQLILSSKEKKEGLSVSVSPFTGNGVTLETNLLEGYYFEIDGENVIDPLPPVSGPVEISANTSKSFVIEAVTLPDTPAGDYKATVTVKDQSGREVKTADLFCHVWNFTLPEETSCRTLMDTSWWNVYVYHDMYDGDDSLLYTYYYDFLLKNRICSYDLPYNTKDGLYSDERILAYLDNPRVVAFQALGWKTDLNDENVSRAYEFLSQKPEWLDKAYFYPVDEPLDISMLDKINANGSILQRNFPGYKLIVPMHYNTSLDADNTLDFFEYVRPYVNIWCPHTFFYNTCDEYRKNPKLLVRMNSMLEKNLGTFGQRMAREQEEGDEVWWYVTRMPFDPEITITIDTQAVRYRELFWQQKLYRVDSFLYYMSNDWNFKEFNYGVDSKHEIMESQYDCYGNGVLVYCGKPFDIYGPVGSLRLECVRDGIEDFEYLTICQKLLGDEKTDLIIRSITASLSVYNTDEKVFTDTRVALGNLIESLSES